MDRLLALLFSVTMLLVSLPPRVSSDVCDYSGGICVKKESCSAKSASSSCSSEQPACRIMLGGEEEGACGKDADCSFPICCVCGPCCCLCLVPERPVLHVAPAVPEEERLKPNGQQDFLPQQVCFSIWKPPAFSV
ncbi:MAG: hypothetical protein ACKVUS_18285 [Saprospiraceae bacterium]